MIISFPSPLQKYLISQAMAKGQPIHYAHTIGVSFDFRPPIELRPYDCIWIDTRNGNVETLALRASACVIEREGIVIYRSGWIN